MTPEQEVAFERLFGVSTGELRSRGIDIDSYVRDHFQEAFDRTHPVYGLRNHFISRLLWVLGVCVGIGLVVVVAAQTVFRNDHYLRDALVAAWLVVCAVGVLWLARAWAPVRRQQDRDWASEEATPLLPFRARGAWISRGRTKLAQFWLGSVVIDDGVLSLLDDTGGELVKAPVRQVTVRGVALWMGAGIRLDIDTAGRWFVQPSYSPLSRSQAVRGASRFRAALTAASVGEVPGRGAT